MFLSIAGAVAAAAYGDADEGGRVTHAVKGLVLALVGWLLVACSEGGGQGGTTDAFDDLPGVRDTAIRKEALDTDYYGYTAVVDMEPDASQEEITAALDGLATWFKGRGGEDGVRLYVGGGTTTVEDGWGDGAHHAGPSAIIAAVGSHARNLANAELLLHATEVLDAPVTIRDYEWAVTAEDPRALLGAVLADPQLAAVPGLHLVQNWEGDSRSYWETPPDVSSTEPLSRMHIRAYDQAVAKMKHMREGRAHLDFVGSETGVVPRHTDKYPGAVTIRMTLRLPDMAGPKSLAADPLEDPRWPLVAAQLDLLRTLPRGSVLIVSLEWGRAPEAGSAARHHELVELEKEGKVYRSPFWNDEAAAYLAR